MRNGIFHDTLANDEIEDFNLLFKNEVNNLILDFRTYLRENQIDKMKYIIHRLVFACRISDLNYLEPNLVNLKTILCNSNFCSLDVLKHFCIVENIFKERIQSIV